MVLINRQCAIFSLIIAAISLYGCSQEPIRQTSGIDEEAQLPYWQIGNKGMSLRLVQRLPMQTRGFFLARGFTAAQAEQVAQSCVFQTVFKNTSLETTHPSPLSYNLKQWTVYSNGRAQGLKLREHWAAQWKSEKIARPQRLAFEWSIYPSAQEYQPGDYNWGMSTFNLKPGSRFDLRVVWRQFGQTRHALIKNIQCAADINPLSSGRI